MPARGNNCVMKPGQRLEPASTCPLNTPPPASLTWKEPRMGSLSSAAVAAYVVLHFGAIASAWGTRMAIGSRVESLMQIAFLVALAAIGFSTWFCHEHDLGLGIPSGMTLIAMVLM